ncbi:hypothetical protein FRC12_001788 [Ceratobasidium sp. 428]|nr:hypothetical protein FRC12_001788 [Ceratobasidium sp. 428]
MAKDGAGPDAERSILTRSFERKKGLSATAESLDGDKLEEVIEIIYKSKPDLQNVNLYPPILTSTNSYYLSQTKSSSTLSLCRRPRLRSSGTSSLSPSSRKSRPPVHRAQAHEWQRVKGAAATGGIKRNSMDEAAWSERIRELKAQINRFGGPSGTNGGFEANGLDDGAHSSGAPTFDSDSGGDSDQLAVCLSSIECFRPL